MSEKINFPTNIVEAVMALQDATTKEELDAAMNHATRIADERYLAVLKSNEDDLLDTGSSLTGLWLQGYERLGLEVPVLMG